MADDPRDLFQGQWQHGLVGDDPVQLADALPTRPADEIHELTLQGLAHGLALFTHGPLFTYGGLDFNAQDPLREFVDRRPGCNAAFHDFPEPLFQGIARRSDQEEWDRRLFFVDLAYWSDLLPWLANVSCLDRGNRKFHRAEPQVVRIVDLPAYARQKEKLIIPTVGITVFGVTGNFHRIAFRSHVRTPYERALAVRLPLDRKVRKEAELLFDEDKDPFGSKEPVWRPTT